jgi:hypothetical protein
MMPEKWSADGTARGGPIERAERARFELLMGRHLKTYPFILTSAAYRQNECLGNEPDWLPSPDGSK